MRKTPCFMSLLLFPLLLSDCQKSNPVTNSSPIELIPLTPGNTWISTSSSYDSNGTVLSTTIESLWVSKDTVVDAENYFLLFSQAKHPDGTPYPQIYSYLAKNSPSGYTERNFFGGGQSYNYPCVIGDSTVVSVNESVTVPAGTYNCIVYKFPAGLLLVDSVYQILYGKSYICPNIGIAKKEVSIPHNAYAGYRIVLTRAILNHN